MASPAEELGRYVRRRRKALRLSQAAVARLTGKAQPQIAGIEAGGGNPSYELATQLLRSLGVELVAVPIRLLPAVRHLIDVSEGVAVPQRTRLIGNDPESAHES